MQIEHCRALFAPFREKTLLVGFSGGADSTAALLLAERFQCELRYHLSAIHFNHGLRGAESDREAREAEEFAGRRGIDFRCIRLSLSPGANLEARARAARFRAYRQLLSSPEAGGVVLGHHADDRAETLLLRLARGSNVSALAALRADATVAGVRLLRPLLHCSRTEIEEFLRRNGVRNWALDSSNRQDNYVRNRLRNQILPAFYTAIPGSRPGLQHALDALEEDADFLETEAAGRLQALQGSRVTAAQFWRDQPPAMLVRLLRGYLREQLGRELPPRPELLEQFRRLLRHPVSGECRQLPLGEGGSFSLRHDLLTLHPPAPPITEPDLPWNWQTTSEIVCGGYRLRATLISELPGFIPLDSACFDAGPLPEILHLTSHRPGDRMRPFGKTGAVRLKKLRTDRGLPATETPPVLRLPSGEILWAPRIRHSALATVTAATTHILRCDLFDNND